MKKPVVNYYRRHQRSCPAGHKQGSFSGEYEERKKGWKKCDCPISVSGTWNEKFHRRSLGVWDWEQARSLMEAELEGPPPGTALVVAAPALPVARVAIGDAIDAYLNHHQQSARNTVNTYRYTLKGVQAFLEERGYQFLDQVQAIDIRDLRDGWARAGKAVKSSKQTLSWLRTFFRFCIANQWLEIDPADKIRIPRSRSAKRAEPKLPFSDEELQRMSDACSLPTGSGDYTGQDLHDFIALSIHTGLRISDVVQFHISRLEPNGDIRIRTTKTGTAVSTWIPQWLQARLRARAITWGPHLFGRQSFDFNTPAARWRKRLKVLFDKCGPWEHKPTPHRFRHTFVRILLAKSVPVPAVADLIGDTEEVLRAHYAQWVPERQDRIRQLLQEAFDSTSMALPERGTVLEFSPLD